MWGIIERIKKYAILNSDRIIIAEGVDKSDNYLSIFDMN